MPLLVFYEPDKPRERTPEEKFWGRMLWVVIVITGTIVSTGVGRVIAEAWRAF